ncbi:TRNA dihydrouridine synthase [Spironucleus salmonicida]|uniref:tRNA dihydrouridine synthase n=1 Tax=Spironucleus salmonicida TaxID=348837 RepID=V6LT98_9EUKA|nr:TRNA dihydrouridine synthase [Spironucleus salmonicida]|eukprot:EST44014.1 tRNA dihydrouridine synthase [Spironucleus salmonicida]
MSNNILFYYAPMCHLTGLAYRQLLRFYHPGVLFITQMFSTEAINYNDLYKQQLLTSFIEIDKLSTQLQVVSPTIESLIKALPFISQLNISGINLNLACPAQCAQKAGYGEYFPKNLIKQCLSDLKQNYFGKISVKVRLPEDQSTDIQFFEQFNNIVDTVIIHARRKRLSNQKAQRENTDFSAVALIQQQNFSFKIIINGGIKSKEHGEELCNMHNVAGYMIGLELARNPRLITIEKWFSQTNPLYYYINYFLQAQQQNLRPTDSKTEIIRHIQMLGSKVTNKEDYANLQLFLLKLDKLRSQEFQ